jgi:hypothetical protein
MFPQEPLHYFLVILNWLLYKGLPHLNSLFISLPHLSHFPTWLSRSFCTNRISLLLHPTFNQNPVGDPFKIEIWLLYDTLPFTSMCVLYVLKLLDIHLQISEWKKSVAFTSTCI